MALEDVFQTGWGVWVNLILGNIGGTEAKLLSVSVTATMIIIGILTYIVLRYVILARFGEALPDEQKNVPSIIISVCLVFIMLYSGSIVLVAALLPISTALIILAMFILFVVALWSLSHKFYSELRGFDKAAMGEHAAELQEFGGMGGVDATTGGESRAFTKDLPGEDAEAKIEKAADATAVQVQGTNNNISNVSTGIGSDVKSIIQNPNPVNVETQKRKIRSLLPNLLGNLRNAEQLVAREKKINQGLKNTQKYLTSLEKYVIKAKILMDKNKIKMLKGHNKKLVKHKVELNKLREDLRKEKDFSSKSLIKSATALEQKVVAAELNVGIFLRNVMGEIKQLDNFITTYNKLAKMRDRSMGGVYNQNSKIIAQESKITTLRMGVTTKITALLNTQSGDSNIRTRARDAFAVLSRLNKFAKLKILRVTSTKLDVNLQRLKQIDITVRPILNNVNAKIKKMESYEKSVHGLEVQVETLVKKVEQKRMAVAQGRKVIPGTKVVGGKRNVITISGKQMKIRYPKGAKVVPGTKRFRRP